MMRFVAIFLISLLSSYSQPSNAYSLIFVSEFHYDNEGTDKEEFVEITGISGADLAGWRLALYNGSGGGVYQTIELIGTFSNQVNGYGAIAFSPRTIQNGRDAIALIDDTDQVIQFISYEGLVTASDGYAKGMTSKDIGVHQNASETGYSLQAIGPISHLGDISWQLELSTAGKINSELVVTQVPEPSSAILLFCCLVYINAVRPS